MKNLLITLATIFTVAMLIFAAGYSIPKILEIYKAKPIIEKVDTTKVDTVLTDKKDTLYLRPKKPYVEIKYKTVTDTLLTEKHDTVLVEVPLSVKKYKGDTLSSNGMKVQYRANVSGYRASLDSLWFAVERNDTTIYKEVTVTKWKKKHWNYGIVGGVGYGMVNQKPDCFIGVGISYNF